MKKIIATSLLITLTLISCDYIKTKQLEKDIIGEWKYIKTENYKVQLDYQGKPIPPPPPPPVLGKGIDGFVFFEDKSCERKLGYFKKIKRNDYVATEMVYLGNKTKYKIENDSLKIFDISDSTWLNMSVFSIIGDTMTIKIDDNCFEKFSRNKYKINPNENYDRIIVSSTGCYGSCPISNICIDKSGDILYMGERFNTINGFYSSKITKQEYQDIETTFKKTDIYKLNEKYYAKRTDNETVSIVFIKDNTIVKSIEDYGEESPIELIWAYTPIRFLYQNLNLIPIKTDIPIFAISNFNFYDGDKICLLSKAESFFLLSEIYKGKATTKNITLKYQFDYWSIKDKKEKLYTDGQFYKIGDKTIDIGYNFLTKNNLTNKFRVKTEYER